MRRVFGCLLLIGCAHSQTQARSSSSVEVAQYYPLAVGNSWNYSVELLGSPPQSQQISIVKEEQGHFTDSSGNVLWRDAFGVRDEKRYLLRQPLEVGAHWNSLVSVSSYEQYSILEAGHACQAPAGSFLNCVVVESRNKADADKTLVATLTFAPKVGLIRIATVLEAEGKRLPQATLELTSYQVAAEVAPAPAK